MTRLWNYPSHVNVDGDPTTDTYDEVVTDVRETVARLGGLPPIPQWVAGAPS